MGVSVSPQIPFLNDDMEQVLAAAFDAGARRAFQVLRLPWELAPMFRQWLALHYPDRAARDGAYAGHARGQGLRCRFRHPYAGPGIWAQLLHQRFVKCCDRLGYQRERHALDVSRFTPSSLRPQQELFSLARVLRARWARGRHCAMPCANRSSNASAGRAPCRE